MSSNRPPPIPPNTNPNVDDSHDDNTTPSVPVVTEASQSSEEFDPVSTSQHSRSSSCLPLITRSPKTHTVIPPQACQGRTRTRTRTYILHTHTHTHAHVRSSLSKASWRRNSRDWSIEDVAEIVDPNFHQSKGPWRTWSSHDNLWLWSCAFPAHGDTAQSQWTHVRWSIGWLSCIFGFEGGDMCMCMCMCM